MSVPGKTPVRQSLLRPHLIFGGERELVLASGMLCLMAVYAIQISWLVIVPILGEVAVLAILPRMAKSDPQLSKVYIRHVNKKIYYPAAPHFTAIEPELKKHQ
jgi:type IV secretory pathway TrbD component